MLIYLQMIESDEDKSKFAAIYEKYKGLMFHVAHEIMQNEHDAEDAVHHAFLALLKHLSKILESKLLGFAISFHLTLLLLVAEFHHKAKH